MVGHCDKGVQLKVALAAVFLKGFEEEVRGCGDLKDAAAHVRCAGYEEGSGSRGSRGDRHDLKRTSAAKAAVQERRLRHG